MFLSLYCKIKDTVVPNEVNGMNSDTLKCLWNNKWMIDEECKMKEPKVFV